MRIVHVADFVSEKLGYQELLLAKWNARHAHEVFLVTSNLNPPAPNYKESFEPLLGPRQLEPGRSVHEGVTLVRLPVRAEVRNRVFVKRLARTVSDIQPDVIFVHGTMSPTALIAAHVSARKRVPLVMDNHMVFSVQDTSGLGQLAYRAARVLMRRYLAPRVDRFYGVADECCRFLVDAQGAPPEKVGLLPLGVDTELFNPRPGERIRVRREWGVPDDAFVVAQTGKLDPGKDPMTLARAAGYLARRNSRVHLVLVGAGPSRYVASVRQAFLAEGSPQQFHNPPAVPVTGLSAALSACDVVVYPGGTSMSALEAAACERVVIMNDQPASLWRAAKGVGCTFPEGDDGALAELVDYYQANPMAASLAGATARGAVVAEFSYDAVSRNLLEDLENLRASASN